MQAVEDMGIVVTDFFPPNAYHMLATMEELEDLKARFEILYAGEYLPEYKTTSASAEVMSMKSVV